MKKILIFGASSGYGLGIALTMMQEGWHVVAVCRNRPPKPIVTWIRTDVTNLKDMDKLALRIQSLEFDAVVYSAGIAIERRVVTANVSPLDWQQVFATNTLGLLNAAKITCRRLLARKGLFVHIGSIANALQYMGGADYCASKAASSSIMKSLRLEWLGSGIRTCSIEPGLGETNFQISRYGGDSERAAQHTAGIQQLQPADLGEAVRWLATLPPHVNIDELVIKPLDQATHGVTFQSKKNTA